MRAERAELTWDDKKQQWLLRIIIGEEVIRRHLKSKRDADQQTLGGLAVQTASDEGYELDPAKVNVTAP